MTSSHEQNVSNSDVNGFQADVVEAGVPFLPFVSLSVAMLEPTCWE